MVKKIIVLIFLLFIISGNINAQTIIIPTSQQSWAYAPVDSPVMSSDPSQAKPVGVGSVATGGSILSIQIGLNQFSDLVDIYGAFTVSTDPDHVNVLNPDGASFTSFTVSEIENALLTGTPPIGAQPWKANVTGSIDEHLFDILISEIPSGTYTAYLLVTPTGSLIRYYIWATRFLVCGDGGDTRFVYKDYGASENNFSPSGWMGDISAISFDDNWTSNCYSGSSCIKLSFEAKGSNWAGIYWQDPENNWGENPDGGFDLSGCTKITFKTRGENGGENIEFFAGGIDGTYGDSFSKTSTGDISITQNWQEYNICLTGKDLSHVIGGFGWATNSDNNPQGATFYLDEIKYECS